MLPTDAGAASLTSMNAAVSANGAIRWKSLQPSCGREKSGRQFEPEARPCIDEAPAGVPSHIASHDPGDLPELLEIAAAWRGLPDVLKGAVLGIVRSAQPGDRQ